MGETERKLYHEPKVPFLVWVLPVADQNHSFISSSLPARPLGKTNWLGKQMAKRGRNKTGLPLLSSNRYPAHEGSLMVRFPVPPERWHSPTLEANVWQPLCSTSISWQLTINRCARKVSLHACTISAVLGSNTGSLCQSHGLWMLSNCYFCWRPLPLGLRTNQHITW